MWFQALPDSLNQRPKPNHKKKKKNLNSILQLTFAANIQKDKKIKKHPVNNIGSLQHILFSIWKFNGNRVIGDLKCWAGGGALYLLPGGRSSSPAWHADHEPCRLQSSVPSLLRSKSEIKSDFNCDYNRMQMSQASLQTPERNCKGLAPCNSHQQWPFTVPSTAFLHHFFLFSTFPCTGGSHCCCLRTMGIFSQKSEL